jgi:hypothetical protein
MAFFISQYPLSMGGITTTVPYHPQCRCSLIVLLKKILFLAAANPLTHGPQFITLAPITSLFSSRCALHFYYYAFNTFFWTAMEYLIYSF